MPLLPHDNSSILTPLSQALSTLYLHLQRSISYHLFHSIYNSQWDTARNILSSSKSNLQTEYVGVFGKNALHAAFHNKNTPVDIIRRLIAASPTTAPLKQDGDGYTPLHYSIRRHHLPEDEAVIRTLLQRCPHAATMVDNTGKTPLHHAIIWNTSPGVIECLLGAYPLAMSTVSRGGRGPLDTFYRKWNAGLKVILASRDASLLDRTIREETRADHGPHNPDMFLYFFLMHSLESLDEEDVITDADYINESRSLRDVIHILHLLLRAAAASSKNNRILKDLTPFEMIRSCLSDQSCPLSFIRLLLALHPSTTSLHDASGNYLLHTAAMTKSSFYDGGMYKCVRCLSLFDDRGWYQNQHHNGVKLCDRCFRKKGEEEVFLKMTSDDKIPTAIHDIVTQNPTIASIPNNAHQLPLHLSLSRQSSFEKGRGVESLLEAAPMALTTRDVRCHLYPFMMAACCVVAKDEASRRTMPEEERRVELNSCRRGRLDQFGLCYSLLIESPHLLLHFE